MIIVISIIIADMQENRMKISVVIPAYNCERYISRAIDSVLSQTWQAHEIVVVDDGSTDSTADKVKDYGDKVRYIYQDNAGPGAARNKGVDSAKGDWIGFLDSDDVFMAERLEFQARLLEAEGEAFNMVWCGGDYERILSDGTDDQGAGTIREYDINNDEIYEDYFQAYMCGKKGWTGTMLVRRDVLLELGGFRTDVSYAEDLDLWFRIAYKYPAFGYIAVPLAKYYLGIPGSLATQRQSVEAEIEFWRRHIELAIEQCAWDRCRPIAVSRLKGWIRSAMFDDRIYNVKDILAEFGMLFSSGYRLRVRMLLMFPGLTNIIFQFLSKMNRKYKFRDLPVHPKN